MVSSVNSEASEIRMRGEQTNASSSYERNKSGYETKLMKNCCCVSKQQAEVQLSNDYVNQTQDRK